MALGIFSIARLAVFGTTLLFALIVLGLSADILAFTEKSVGGYFYFSALAVATALITLLTIAPMIIIDFIRRGAFTSLIVVEVVWLGILWVLWIATAAYAAYTDGVAYDSVSCSDIPSAAGDAKRVCNEFKAIIAFSFLAWVLLMGYTKVLIICAFIGSLRGNKTWTTTVKDVSFFTRQGKFDNTAMQQQPQQQQFYPPQSEQQYSPQQYSPQPQSMHPMQPPSPGIAQV